jgi:hypothetical protein
VTDDRLDACRDVGALIRATADRDHEAIEIILDYSDNRAVAEILAILVVTACRGYGDGFIGDVCDELRHRDQEDPAP